MRIYTVPFNDESITNANATVDFWTIQPADDVPVTVLGYTIDQFTDLGDANEEVLRMEWLRGHTTIGSGGNVVTPSPIDPKGVAADGVYHTVDTTIASVATPVSMMPTGFNIRIGERIFFPDGLGPRVDQGNTTMVFRLTTAVGSTIVLSGCLWVGEGA